QLRHIRDRVHMDAPYDVRGQSPVVGGIAYRKPLIERGVAPRHRATVVEISSNQVANAPSIAEVPGQLAEHRRVVHAVKIGAWQSAFWDYCSLHAAFPRGPRRQQLYSPAEKRPGVDQAMTGIVSPVHVCCGLVFLQPQSTVLMAYHP